MPTIYAVASVKGGVGKTTTAANLAATLAAAGHDTVAVDADLGSASLAPTLGVEPGDVTLHDVLAGEADPVDATVEGPHGLAVVPGGTTLEAFRKADPEAIVDVLESITGAEYVVVDTGAGLTHQTALPLSVADGVLLVSTPTRDGLANTRKTQDLTAKLDGEVAGLALNEADGDEDTGDVDVPVLGAIPDDPLVAEAQAAGSPLSAYASDSDAAAAYRSLASSLTGEPIRPAPTPDRSEATPDDPAYDAAAGDDTDSGSDPDPASEPAPESEPAADPAAVDTPDADPADADADADVPEDAVPFAGDPESPEEDDAVILGDEEDGDAADAEEDEAAAAARGTVLADEEYAAFRGGDGDRAATVEDAETGESAEIGEDVIPFAQQSKERTERAKREQGDDDGDDEERDGGFLGRLFR
ncbi:P-loop NTPase [Halobaculum sp. EA56]|uniref:P-loop NTPase n=1 Tax=Halobaculum sp. EA56 TaxID=3421648 RepID=UPI003EBADB38